VLGVVRPPVVVGCSPSSAYLLPRLSPGARGFFLGDPLRLPGPVRRFLTREPEDSELPFLGTAQRFPSVDGLPPWRDNAPESEERRFGTDCPVFVGIEASILARLPRTCPVVAEGSS